MGSSNIQSPSAAPSSLRLLCDYTSVLTLRILAARHNLLWTKDGFLSVVSQDTYSCFQHAHGGKCVTTAT